MTPEPKKPPDAEATIALLGKMTPVDTRLQFRTARGQEKYERGVAHAEEIEERREKIAREAAEEEADANAKRPRATFARTGVKRRRRDRYGPGDPDVASLQIPEGMPDEAKPQAWATHRGRFNYQLFGLDNVQVPLGLMVFS